MRPELILYNANIITVDDAQPRAQAAAIADGRFLAVGSSDDVRNLAAAGTPAIDLVESGCMRPKRDKQEPVVCTTGSCWVTPG